LIRSLDPLRHPLFPYTTLFRSFQVFTRAEHLKRWWAPQPYTVPVCTIDLRPGGIWHYCLRSPEGEVHWARSVYREIVPPEKLVRSEEHTSELQSRENLVCRLLL